MNVTHTAVPRSHREKYTSNSHHATSVTRSIYASSQHQQPDNNNYSDDYSTQIERERERESARAAINQCLLIVTVQYSTRGQAGATPPRPPWSNDHPITLSPVAPNSVPLDCRRTRRTSIIVSIEVPDFSTAVHVNSNG